MIGYLYEVVTYGNYFETVIMRSFNELSV